MKLFDASLQAPEFSEDISKSDQNGNDKHCNLRKIFRKVQNICQEKTDFMQNAKI